MEDGFDFEANYNLPSETRKTHFIMREQKKKTKNKEEKKFFFFGGDVTIIIIIIKEIWSLNFVLTYL